MNNEDFNLSTDAKASLVSIITPRFEGHESQEETDRSLQELRELLRTLGIKAQDEYVQNKKSLEAGTILGSGKLNEIAEAAKREGSDLLVFDFELTASQVRNIKKITKMDVTDRCHIILEIFAKHAQTRDAKIQIEISKLEYLLPRLSTLWTHFTRQKGGIGLKGEGEQQLELDRRIIKERIGFLKKQLITLKTSREEQKKRRQKKTITTALVGYTNAGKSSIMNKMCKVDILAEDKLFATLDSTFRMLNPDTKPPMILVDTVGFISNLPASLVNGFKTTLESALDADLLLIVCDLSDPNVEKHIEVTNEVLKELNITDKSCFYIFNKKDKVHNLPEKLIQIRKYPNREIVSSQDKEDMKRLREKIITYFLDQQNEYELFVPYADGQVHSKILSKTNIIVTHNHEQGIFYKVKVPDFIFNPLNLNPYLMAPNDPRRDYIK